MAIKLMDTGFSIVPEGEHIFKIVEVEYKATYGKMTVTMATQKGLKHTERYSLIKKNDEVNEGAMKAFSFFAKTALNNFSLDEIEENDLIGHYIKGTVEHTQSPSTKEPDRMMTFVKLTNLSPAVGFESTGDPLDELDNL